MRITITHTNAFTRHPEAATKALAVLNTRRARLKRAPVAPHEADWSYDWCKQIMGKHRKPLLVQVCAKVGLQTGHAPLGAFSQDQTLMPEITQAMAPPPLVDTTIPHAGTFAVGTGRGHVSTELVVGGYARLGKTPGIYVLTLTLGKPNHGPSLYRLDGHGGCLGWSGGLRTSAEKAYQACADGGEWRWGNRRFQRLSFADIAPLLPTSTVVFGVVDS